jgi:hypothetical protein
MESQNKRCKRHRSLKFPQKDKKPIIEFKVDANLSSRVTVIKGIRFRESINLSVLVDIVRAEFMPPFI